MLQSKKFIVTVLLVVVALAGSLGGVALAQADDDATGQPDTFLERITAILVESGVNITSEQLKDAFSQATTELQGEAMENRLKALVEAEMITQEEADQYREWMESKPDVSFGFQFKNRGRFSHMNGSPAMHGFPGAQRMQGFCAPALPTE